MSSKNALLVTGIDNTVTTFVMRKRFFAEKEKVDMVENARKIVNGVHTASIIDVSSSVLQPLVSRLVSLFFFFGWLEQCDVGRGI